MEQILEYLRVFNENYAAEIFVIFTILMVIAWAFELDTMYSTFWNCCIILVVSMMLFLCLVDRSYFFPVLIGSAYLLIKWRKKE